MLHVRPRKSRYLWPIWLGALLLGPGCSALTVPDAPPAATPLTPRWDQRSMRAHLQFLHSDAVRGRADATVGFSIAAAYVRDRLREYRLQPALESDFRILHTARRNVVSGARLRLEDADSVSFVLGQDYLPDGRTAAFGGRVATLWLNDVSGAEAEPGSALLWSGELGEDAAARIRASRVGVVFVVGSLAPKRYAERWTGQALVEMTPAAANRIMTETVADSDRPTRRTLGRALQLDIAASWSAAATGINVVGFVPGKHPAHMSEAVILCTHLDATGVFASVPTLDTKNVGIEVAAALEVARRVSEFSRHTGIPERTLIVAFLSGGTVDSSGLRALLSTPLWEGQKIRSVIYLGQPAAGPSGLSGSVPSRILLHTVAARRSAVLPDTVMLLARPRGGQRTEDVAADAAQTYLAAAAAAARELAARTYVLATSELILRADEPPAQP